MEDLKQALRDFVATSNSGKYTSEAELLSKFPELQGYDVNALRDFVATSNSGKYASEEELFSKFPEFGQPVKKKEESSVPLWLQNQEQPKPKPEPTLPFLESKPSGISLGSQRVPETAPMFEAPPMRTPEEAQAIVETPEYKETPYFTGTFGQLLRNMESPWNPAAWIADKIDDFGRAVGQGSAQGDIVGPTSKIFLNGDKVSDSDIEKFRKASEMAERIGPSDEMVNFTKQYQEEGKTTAGFLKALAMNPGAIPEIMVSSYTSMVNSASLAAAGTVVGGGTATGAATGSAAGGVGAIPGAVAGAVASIPYAMAAAGATLETNLSLAESIKDKLEQDGLEWNDENIKAVISDKNFLNDARVKAATRGVTIGAIDALTGRIAGKVGAKLLKAPKAGVAKSAAAAGSIEAVGGSAGEATARGLTGEEMDVAEIGLEGIAELPGTVVSVGAEVLKKPVYKINGEIRPETDVQEIINTATGDDLSKINIEIINDKKGYKQQIQDKVVSSQVKKEVRDVNPELPEETIDEIVSLEMERKKFEGKKTQSAKDKLASINSQIKTLQENAVQKPSTKEGVLRPEEPQVGLQEVGEGDTQEQAPTEEVVKEEVITAEPKAAPLTDEEIQSAFDRLEMPEDVETLPGIDDELNKINESIGRVKEEGNTRDDERTLMDLGDKIARAKRNVASAEDTEAAIDELRQAQKERDDFEQSIEKRKNFNTVDALISEEIYQKDRDKETYEYQELFNQDPRLAALQSAKDMVEFLKTEKRGEDRVSTYENHIKVLEEDIAKFPVKKAEVVSPATPTLSEESQKIKTQLEDFRDTFDEAYNAEYPTSGTAQQKRSAIAKSKKAIKKLQQMMGFDIGVYWELDADQTKKREALYSLRENKDYDSYDEMVAAYQKDVADGNQSKLVESVNTLLGIAPAKPKVSSKTQKGTTFKKKAKKINDNLYEFEDAQGVGYIAKKKVGEVDTPRWVVVTSPESFDFDHEPFTNLKDAVNYIEQSNKRASEVKAKSVPIPVAIPKPTPPTPVVKEQAVATPKVAKTKAVAPAKEEVAPVKEAEPAPTTKAVGPEALRQEYIDKTAEVRLNKDKSRTPKQIEERVAELRAEYQKLKAEMTAPKPKVKVEEKAEAKPKTETKPSRKDEAIARDIKRLESDIDTTERKIQSIEEDIEIEKGNIKELLEEIRKKRNELKGKKMPKAEREEANEQIKADIIDANNEHDGLIEEYQNDIAAEKADLKKYQKELAKLKAKQAEPVSVVEEEEPSYDDIKDLDVSDPTFLEIVEGFLDDMDDGLSEFGRGNLSSGMAIPLAKAIIKSLKVLVKAGITLQEAIKRVAAENNLEAKDIVNMIKELDSAQSPMVKLKAQVQNEIEAVKIAGRKVNDATQAIVNYFNFNAERGNLTRRDLGRVINVIAKVKDQKSLGKAADKIFEIIDKAKTDVIEVSESKALVSQIKLEARAALNAKKDVNQKRKDLSNVIKAMETTGRISAAKARAILNKIGKVNLDNPASVDAFLDYVENVFEDAAYEVELAGINAKIARAKNNVNKKIGTVSGLTPLLDKLFSIKPSFIPAEVFDSYKEIIDMFGDSAAVLDLAEVTEVTQQVESILEQIGDQTSTIPALATKLFDYESAVLTEEGALDYAATIDKMKADETINDEEYALMKKYKSYILPKVSVIPKTKQELEAEKKELVDKAKDAANQASISQLASADEKKMASNIIKLSKTKAVESLNNRQLENLIKIFDNFSNGYFPAYANEINNDLIAAENAGYLSRAISKAKMPTLLSVKVKLRNKREGLFAKVKSVPLFNIDEIFGDFKTKDIFNSILNSLAQNQQRYALEMEKINQRLEDVLNDIAKAYGNNENKIVESKMKLETYLVQREFESNPGDPEVNHAIEYINDTVKAIREGNTNYSEEDADILEKIANDYNDNKGNVSAEKKGDIEAKKKGGIDAKKLYNSFNASEKEAIELFTKINKSLEDKVVFTGDVVRGNKVRLRNNYNHISVLPTKNNEADPIADVMSKFDSKNVASTKAKSLIERTPGAKAISFDAFATVQRGAKFVLMDYYLTNPVRIARKTINTTKKMMEENNTLTKDANNIINVLGDAVELALKSSLDQSAFNDTFAEKVIQEMAKTGYRAMLGGIPRATTEFTSNMAYIAMVAPNEWSAGAKMMKSIDGSKAVNIMEAVGSKVITRVYGSDPLKGRLVDPSVLSKRVGIGASKLKGETLNVISTIHNNSTKKVKNSAEFVADTLISTPDKIMMRPLWFGSFDKAFQDFSGSKPDYDKIASNDADYMIQNKDALEAAGRVADEKVTMAGNVENPYMNALRTYISSDEKGWYKAFKVFDNFMLKFQIGEYLTARRGINAMMGNGNISKAQGAKLMAAVITRMTVYTVMSKMAAEFMYGLFLDDEDDDDDKSFAQKLGQGLGTTFTSLLFGRDYGNTARSLINYGVEKVNEKYLDFLRDGEYDPYEDAIQYTFIPPEKKGKSLEAFDVIANISGPYSPAVKSLNFVTKKLTEEPKKEADAIERQEKERNIRVPLEILGNLGYVPMYKDIRAIVNKSIYSELDKELDSQGQKEEEFKPMGLNKTDLKRYYPEIYEQYYGEGTEEDAKRKLEYEKNRLEREMKDEYYQYVPKQRSKAGFGGRGFGTGTGKKSGGFGSKGFGK